MSRFQILEQVEGGDLVVNKGNELKPKETSNNREINAVEGFEQALKLAQVCFHSLWHKQN